MVGSGSNYCKIWKGSDLIFQKCLVWGSISSTSAFSAYYNVKNRVRFSASSNLYGKC